MLKKQYEMKYPHTKDSTISCLLWQTKWPFCLPHTTLCDNECPNLFNELIKFHFSAYPSAMVPYLLL